MKKIGIRGSVFVGVVTVIVGAASGVALSLAARAQVEETPDQSEFGNPGGGSDYCVYDILRTNGGCGNIGSGSVICAPCTNPAPCPDYGGRNRRVNARVPAVAGCEVFAITRGTACNSCDVGGVTTSLAPLP